MVVPEVALFTAFSSSATLETCTRLPVGAGRGGQASPDWAKASGGEGAVGKNQNNPVNKDKLTSKGKQRPTLDRNMPHLLPYRFAGCRLQTRELGRVAGSMLTFYPSFEPNRTSEMVPSRGVVA
jgi:hypothetical protein